jgi:hypothetical protein
MRVLLDAQPARRRRLRFEGEEKLKGEVKAEEEGSLGTPAKGEQQAQQMAHGAGQVSVRRVSVQLG